MMATYSVHNFRAGREEKFAPRDLSVPSSCLNTDQPTSHDRYLALTVNLHCKLMKLFFLRRTLFPRFSFSFFQISRGKYILLSSKLSGKNATVILQSSAFLLTSESGVSLGGISDIYGGMKMYRDRKK